MPNRVLAQKALKLKNQKVTVVLGSRKRHSRNLQALSKFSPKNERSFFDATPKPTVPSYDLAMVKRYDNKGKEVRR